MILSTKVRVGRRRTIVIPKAIAEALGISDGSILKLEVRDGRIILEPILDAMQLSLRGRRVIKVSANELRTNGVENQKEYLSGT